MHMVLVPRSIITPARITSRILVPKTARVLTSQAEIKEKTPGASSICTLASSICTLGYLSHTLKLRHGSGITHTLNLLSYCASLNTAAFSQVSKCQLRSRLHILATTEQGEPLERTTGTTANASCARVLAL